MSPVRILKSVVLHIEEEAMSLLSVILLLYLGFCLSYVVAVSTYLCVVCHHFCCPMSLFQSHVSCRNFALTGPLKSWMSFHMWVTHTLKRFKFSYSWLPITRTFKGNRKRFELSGVRVIESSKKIAESMVKNSFYGTVNILITFNFRNVEWKLKDTFRL